MRYFIVFITLIFSQINFAQYITIDESLTPDQLVQNVLINSGCASVSNVSANGWNFSSGEGSFGYFNGAGTTFPFSDGIILSTGKVSSAPGPTTPLADDDQNGWLGDIDLDQILNINTTNATVLEFDFTPLGNKISFQYIFSSEEYEAGTNYPCRYSDAFAFLLKPVGASAYQNLALIPNTNIPVKVTTVHPNIPASGGCPAQNEQYFDQFNGIEYPTVYNGQTVVLSAQSTVIPNTPYHIKLVIADEQDGEYDSAIFIKGGSFDFGVDLGTERTLASGNPVCPDETITLDATDVNVTSYEWFLDNVAILGETNPTLTLTPPHSNLQNGIYSVKQTYSATCEPISRIELDFAPTITANELEFTACDSDELQDGINTFNLNSLIPNIYPTLPSGYQVAFFDSPTSTTPLTTNYTNTTAHQQIIYAKILNGNCYSTDAITLNINTFDEIVEDEIFHLCKGRSIELDAGSGFNSYTWNTTPVQNSQIITISEAGIYEVILENSTNCFKTKTFTVISSDIATIEDISVVDIADNNTVTIITSGSGQYIYSINGVTFQESNIFENLSFGEYTVYIKDINGCGITSDVFYIIDYPKFFTPNGDGYNDRWKISNLEKRNLENSKIYIFDRYGKLLKQISPTGNGWDGTYNNEQLPAQDFWFVLELTNGKTIKSHFSLKR